MVPVLWAVVLISALVSGVAAFVGYGPQGATLEGVGVLFLIPVGLVCSVAIGGLRGRWDRGLAGVGLVAAGLTFGIAGYLFAAISVGRGLGSLFTAVAGGSTQDEHHGLLGVTGVGAIVWGIGCLFALVVGPPRPFVIDPDPGEVQTGFSPPPPGRR